MFKLTDKKRLFLISFLSLFLELALIRYIPANVVLVGFFSNLILIATFAGLGLGLLLTKRKLNLFFFSPLLLLFLIILIRVFQVEIKTAPSEVIFFKNIVDVGLEIEPYFLLPVLFTFVALIFIPLGQFLGKMFEKFSPLTAYSIDILGALAGIILFSLMAFFSTPAWIWFVVISAIFIYLAYAQAGKTTFLLLPVLATLIYISWFFNRQSVWSPYSKITVSKVNTVYNIYSNNIPHQYIGGYANREPFYFIPYERVPNTAYKKILIIGAGAGGDTALALASAPNLEEIDAVEIDPIIANYGKQLNPDHPYDNPKVKVYVTDGRNFLQNTDKKYDLIIFALTDSLTLANMSGNIRLESFLFTKESFELAKSHLTDNGLFVLYNYYRERWLIDKLAGMLKGVFGNQIYIIRAYGAGRPATLLAGPKIKNIFTKEVSTDTNSITANLEPAEDNWPFLYLKNKSVPVFYLNFLSVIAVVVIVLFGLTKIKGEKFKFDLRFFLFGVGFLLLETKSLTTFSLLFGTTWLVNSLVFAGILIFVLIANLISTKVTIKPLWILYFLLVGILTLNFLIPPSVFLGLSYIPRYLLSIIFYFSPIMLANLIFSQLFKKTQNSGVSFGSNMLGGVFGGLLEYSALALGQNSLIILVVFIYLLSLVNFKLRKSS